MPLPVNISLMDVERYVKEHNLQQVKSLFIRESSSDQFHHEGLFSEDIFGQIGSPARLVTFGYIDLRTTIIQPFVYNALIRIKRFYGDIMAGKTYAVFDPNERNFVQADSEDPGAGTGYKFFIDKFQSLVFVKTGSQTQSDKIEAIMKYKDCALISKYLVLPAGLRDMKVTDRRMESDSINKLYVSLMNYCNALPATGGDNTDIFDSVRYSIQKKANEIYDMLFDMIEGKFGYFQRKYSGRNLALGTRNVITPADMSGRSADDPSFLKCDEVMLPLFQASKMYQPFVVYWLKMLFINDVFNQSSDQVAVIDKKTFQLSYQPITEDEKNRFLTSEGLEKMINLFRDKEFRFNPVEVENEKGERFYLDLCYDDGDNIYIIRSISDFMLFANNNKMTVDKTLFRPLTYGEMFYTAAWSACRGKNAYVTRYPAIEIGSTVPCRSHLTSTKPNRVIHLYNYPYDNGVSVTLPEYPVLGAPWVDTTVLHPSILKGLGADFDGNCVSGDTIVHLRYTRDWLHLLESSTFAVSRQPKEEIISYLESTSYLAQDGYNHASIPIDMMPRPGVPTLDKNGAMVHDLPYGCEVLSYNSTADKICWSPVTRVTMEEDCEVSDVWYGDRHVTVSTNESLAVFDKETGRLKRVSPTMSINKYTPIVTGLDTGVVEKEYLSEEWKEDYRCGSATCPDILNCAEQLSCRSVSFLLGVLSKAIDTYGRLTYTSVEEDEDEDADRLRLALRFDTDTRMEGFSHLCFYLGIRTHVKVVEPGVRDVLLNPRDASLWLDNCCFRTKDNRLALRAYQSEYNTVNITDPWESPLPLSKADLETLTSLTGKPQEFTTMSTVCVSNFVQYLPSNSQLMRKYLNRYCVQWEMPTRIQSKGRMRVFDLEVPETKVFVANSGIVVWDTVSVNGILSKEANEEVERHLNSKERFVHPSGSLFPKMTDLITLTIYNLSR